MLSRLGKIENPYYSAFKKNNIDLNVNPSSPKNKKSFFNASFNTQNVERSEKSPPIQFPLNAPKTLAADYKIKDIKNAVIYYNEQLPSNSILKMNVSGNKDMLIERLLSHLKKIESCKLIQSAFRGHCVRYSFNLRFDNTSDSREKRKNIAVWLEMSINKTDFFSLEPIEDIPKPLLYFYVDAVGFVYTFNIFSLLQYFIKSKGCLINPYNREKIENASFSRFYNLGILVFKLYARYLPDRSCNEHMHFIYHGKRHNLSLPIIAASSSALNLREISDQPPPASSPEDVENQTDVVDVLEAIIRRDTGSHRLPTITSQHFMTQEELIIENLAQLRERSLNTRIINAFIELDSLGECHTKHSWFTDLNKNMLARFYSNYFEWWNNSPELLESTKHSICIFRNPFLHIEYLDNYSQVSLNDFREACVYLIENMIYAGIDDSHRKLGAFQALSMLSQVSLPARIGLGF